MNKEVVIISDLGESFGGTFAATAHVEVRFSCYFHVLFTLRSFLFKEKSLLVENHMRKKVVGEKDKKLKQA